MKLYLSFAVITAAAACFISGECPSGESCINGHCRVAGCMHDTDCDRGRLCFDHSCKEGRYVNTGSECGGRLRCFFDAYCDTDADPPVCKEGLPGGGGLEPPPGCKEGDPPEGCPCAKTADCYPVGAELPTPTEGDVLVCRYPEFDKLGDIIRQGLWSLIAVERMECRPRVVNRFGEVCDSDWECGGGLTCRFGVCFAVEEKDTCAPDLFYCVQDDDCCSEVCERFTAQGFGGRTALVPTCFLEPVAA